MPNTRAAKKALRQNVVRSKRNADTKKKIDNFVRKIKKAITDGGLTEAEKLFKDLQKTIDKAAKTHVIRKKKVDRNKSRLMKKINALKKK